MKGFLRSKLVLSLAAFLMIAAAIVIPLSGSINRSHASSNSQLNQITPPSFNVQAESQWFWLSHFGNQ
jgi:hypothetical protein